MGGHGQCVNMAVSNAEYAAWDEKKTVECQCDPGYTGADCSLRKCPQGTDPIATVYTNDHSVYKIQWGQTVNKQWKDADEIPNGQVHWTMSYKDDFGDVWTTSAVTTYYQARVNSGSDKGSLAIGPQIPDGTTITSTPFFMDPDYQGAAAGIVNVDGDVTGSGLTTVPAVDAKTKAGDTRIQFSFHDSFIGEQVNASIQALPNDVVRYSYVHTVFNYGKDPDNVFIYPSMGVPAFNSKLNGKTLAAGDTTQAKIVYATGSGVCSADSGFLSTSGSECKNIGNFANGKSVAVNDVKYRFPYFLETTSTIEGPTALAEAYTSCKTNNLCLFITIPEPKGTKEMTVNYKFKTKIRTVKGNAKQSAAAKPAEFDETYAQEISNVNGGTNSLVSVEEVGHKRKWHKLVDGTPIISSIRTRLCMTVLVVACVTSRPASASVSMATPGTSARSAVCSDTRCGVCCTG